MRYAHLVERNAREAVERMPALGEAYTPVEYPPRDGNEVATSAATCRGDAR